MICNGCLLFHLRYNFPFFKNYFLCLVDGHHFFLINIFFVLVNCIIYASLTHIILSSVYPLNVHVSDMLRGYKFVLLKFPFCSFVGNIGSGNSILIDNTTSKSIHEKKMHQISVLHTIPVCIQ